MWLFGKKKKEAKAAQPQVEQKEKTNEKALDENKSPAKKSGTAAKPSAGKMPSKSTAGKTSKTVKADKPVKEAPCAKKTESKPEKKQEKAPAQSEKPAKKAIYRVLFDKESRLWLIKKDGAKRTIASFPTKEEALARVKELSSSNDLNFVVHKKDGKFQKKQ